MKFFHQRSTRSLLALILLFIIGVSLVLLASACNTPGPDDRTATATLTVTPTYPPTLTPTPLPLGSDENPFVIGLVSESQDPQVAAAADELSAQISGLSETAVTGRTFMTYTQLLDAMADGEVHIAWLPPLTYLYASQRGLAEVILLTNHFGVYLYGTQILANIESGFTPFFDPISGLSSADAATALAQFEELRPCWIDPESASGYILPAGLMRMGNITTLPAVVSQSHTAVVRSLYIKGICDFGATYSIIGDPRTASTVQDDLPDVMNRILIIWRSDAVIPNLNLSLLAGLSESERQMITRSFLDLARTPEGKALLSLSAGNYQIEDVRVINDDTYRPLREAAQALDLDLEEMIGK